MSQDTQTTNMFKYILAIALFVTVQAQNITNYDGRIISVTSYPLCRGIQSPSNETDQYCFVGGRASVLCRRPEPTCESGQKVATGFIVGYRDGAFLDHNANCTYFHWIWSCAHDWRVCLNGTVCVCNETTADPAHPESLCNCSSIHQYETNTCTNSPTMAPTLAPTLTPTMVPTFSPTTVPTISPTVDSSSQERRNDSDSSTHGMSSETLFWIAVGLATGIVVVIIMIIYILFKRNNSHQGFVNPVHHSSIATAFENPVYGDVNVSTA